MCGYCMESMLINFLYYEKFNTEFEFHEGFLPTYLQASNELITYLNKHNFQDYPVDVPTQTSEYVDVNAHIEKINNQYSSVMIDTVFCRFYEHFIEHWVSHDLYDLIESIFSNGAIENFTSRINSYPNYKAWSALQNPQLYKDKICWDKFISNKEELIANSEQTLQSYFNWWILGDNKEKSDPLEMMKKTGIMDPIDGTSADDFKRFYSLFPLVFFALTFLSKHKRRAEIIQQIALNSPNDVPDMPGFDLWLQRKAFALCVDEYGIQFILDNYELYFIRSQLIFYVLFKVDLSQSELKMLREFISKNLAKIEFSDSLLELIDELGKVKGYN